MSNNLEVKITADVADLQAKCAIARSEASSLGQELNKLAKQSSTGLLDSSGQAQLQAVAADFVAKGVRCNAVCPGTVDSPSLQQRLRDTGDYEAARGQFVARQPMGRLGEPGEIANLMLYLASDESAFTTGAVHVIDGGWIN